MPKSNHDLLNRLFHHHSKELLAFAGWRVGDCAAEDLVQETYLRFLQHPEPASISNPRAYLYKVAANLGFDHHRKESVRGKYTTETDEAEPDELISPLPGPEALMEGELLLRNCLAALKTLPEIYRHVFFTEPDRRLNPPRNRRCLEAAPANRGALLRQGACPLFYPYDA